ncbi:MAG: hypothetical protein IPJ90_17215 [Anaerolineaceae bacterium]|nr:hypothetical protein [Anaerolineaceae bacterium]
MSRNHYGRLPKIRSLQMAFWPNMAIQTTNQLFHFETDHLLSKWGFADGTLLDNFLHHNGYAHLA